MKKSSPNTPSDVVIVTGLSGAGKTVTLRALEDLGYFCVDNLPLPLLPSLMDLYKKWGNRLTHVAVGIDVRTGIPSREFRESLKAFRSKGHRMRILFLETDNTTLLRRFSETRRRHPLKRSVVQGIKDERRRLREVKALADRIVDTSRLTPTEMKQVVAQTLGLRHPKGMAVSVMSFGYKYGMPIDADIVLDVRFLPNPNYVPSLHSLTGKHMAVARYVFKHPDTKRFMRHLRQMMGFLLKSFAREGKSYLTVAVGCTGGQHRSVAIAEALGAIMRRIVGRNIRISHRDL